MEEPQREVEHWLLYGTADMPVDHTGHVTEHIACRACGYDLVGLQNGKQCPECGSPVGISIRGDLLSHSRPDWTRHVGQHVRIGGLLLMALPVVLAVGLVVAMRAGRPVSGIVPSILLVAWCYMAFQGARPEPTQTEMMRAQRLVRYTAAGLALIIVTGFTAESMGLNLPGPFVFFLGSVAFLAALTVHACWLSDLMLRVPSTDLCDALRYRMWVILALGALLVVLVWAQAAIGAIFFAFFLATPAWILYVLLAGYSCVQCGEMILCESRLAQQNWLEREALLDKEQRFSRVPGEASAADQPIMHRSIGAQDDGKDAQKAD